MLPSFHFFSRGIEGVNDKVRMSFVSYMDEIAVCMGVKPNVPLLFLTDPKLALHVFFGPCSPYQYRLTGPGKWTKARSLILTQWDRILKPLKTRVVEDSPKRSSVSCWMKILGLPMFLGATMFFLRCSGPSWLTKTK